MPHQFTDLLVEGTVAGTAYRKLFCYDLRNVDNLRHLKTRVLDDLKAAGAQLESASEVVLRNYILTDYEHTAFNSNAAKSCALSDQDSWGSGHGKGCRLLAAAPSPRVPIGPADDSRHAMLAIASRQLYDRARGGGLVLPLEARVKPAATQANASEVAPTAVATTADTTESSSSGTQTLRLSGRGVESEPFDITVRDFRARCHLVRVCGGTSVSRLKTGIAAALGCSVVSHWRLMHDGRPLDDELDLADYSIPAGALVELQMTSQQQGHLKAGTAVNASAPSESKEAGGSGSSGGGGGGGVGGNGGGVKVVSTSPNCGAPWATPSGKGAASMVVQVLLPCGRVVQVNRLASEDVPKFICRALEAEKTLLMPPEAVAAAAATLQGLLPLVTLPASRSRNAAPGVGLEVGHPHGASGQPARRIARQLKGVITGQKLLAVLLAAAAVVMAMAVL